MRAETELLVVNALLVAGIILVLVSASLVMKATARQKKANEAAAAFEGKYVNRFDPSKDAQQAQDLPGRG